MTIDAKIHENEPDEGSPKVGPPSVERLSGAAFLENVSKIATTTSPSPRQAWMNSSSNPTVRVRIGPRTPLSQPSEPSPPSVPRSQSSRVFHRTVKDSSPKSNSPVPPLQLRETQQEPPKTQSARTSEKLLSDLQRQLPQSARMPQSARISLRPGNVNRNNPFRKKNPSNSLLPGDNVVSQHIGHSNSEGTGDLGFLSTQHDLSAQPENSLYAVLTQPVPTKPVPTQPVPTQPVQPKPVPPKSGMSVNTPLYKRTIRIGGAEKQNKQTAGHKRTRKHRTPASSTPATATRRHRDQSSSAHKRTRRRREH